MKKLMFAAAVVAAGVAMADVTSANIVGYQAKEPTQYSFVAGTFTMVDGGENFKLADLAVNCSEDGETEDGWMAEMDAVVELSGTGTFVRKIIYAPGWYFDANKGDWYASTDASYETPLGNVVDMPFGHGIQVSISAPNNQKITYSGQVKNAPTITDLAAGYYILGNCSPKDIFLKDVITNCSEDGETEDGWMAEMDAVVELSPTGTFVRKIIYAPGWYFDADKGDWYASTDSAFATPLGNVISFKAGEGFQVSMSAPNNQKVSIKSALATDDAE